MTLSPLRRAFVAVVPPSDVLDALDDALAPVRAAAPPQWSWSRRSQWHLTLRFLGPVADPGALVDALRGGVATLDVFRVGLGDSGAFASTRRATVLWVGIDDGAGGLAQLAATVGAVTAPLGFPPEARDFTAHLTVARARRPQPAGSVLAAIGAGPFGRAWEVREVVLFESDTRPSGAVYREIAALPLQVPGRVAGSGA